MKVKTRRRKHEVFLIESKCVICGTWKEATGQRPRTTCSANCRMRLHRGETPKYAEEAK